MIYTNLNPPQLDKCFEHNSGLSQTEPNQALSVKEIIDRHTAGFATHVEREMFDDSFDVDSPLPMRDPSFDIADAYQMSMDPKQRKVMDIYNQELSTVKHSN